MEADLFARFPDAEYARLQSLSRGRVQPNDVQKSVDSRYKSGFSLRARQEEELCSRLKANMVDVWAHATPASGGRGPISMIRCHVACPAGTSEFADCPTNVHHAIFKADFSLKLWSQVRIQRRLLYGWTAEPSIASLVQVLKRAPSGSIHIVGSRWRRSYPSAVHSRCQGLTQLRYLCPGSYSSSGISILYVLPGYHMTSTGIPKVFLPNSSKMISGIMAPDTESPTCLAVDYLPRIYTRAAKMPPDIMMSIPGNQRMHAVPLDRTFPPSSTKPTEVLFITETASQRLDVVRSDYATARNYDCSLGLRSADTSRTCRSLFDPYSTSVAPLPIESICNLFCH